VWAGENGGFSVEKRRKKRHILSLPSAFSGVLVWTIEENASKSMQFSTGNALLWTGENKTKTLVWSKIFCFVFVEMKTDTFKNALVWLGP